MPATPPPTRTAADPTRARRRSPLARAVLVAGAAVTLVSALALLALLGAYFLSAPAVPALYRLPLYGLPVGFGLLVLYLVLSAVGRGRA